MFYTDKETGEKKSLSEEQSEMFGFLIGAIGDEDAEFVDAILDDNPILAQAFDDDGYTALSFATGHHNTEGLAIVQILMAYGSNVYAESNREITPIHYVNRITDPALKAHFCEAMGIDIDTAAIIKSLIHEKAVAIATERVEARWAAKKAAEEAKTDTDDSLDSVDIAYQRATTFDEKVVIDPIRAAAEYFDDPRVQQMHKTMEDIEIRAVYKTTISEEGQKAIDSSQMQTLFKKSDQLEFPVDQGISEIIADIFGNKKSDVDIDTKESVLGSLCDWLGVDLSQLAYLASVAYGSSLLPFYRGSHDNPDDDFGGSPFGGSSAITFDRSPDVSNPTYILVLGNGTLVFPEDTHSI